MILIIHLLYHLQKDKKQELKHESPILSLGLDQQNIKRETLQTRLCPLSVHDRETSGPAAGDKTETDQGGDKEEGAIL